MFQFESIQEFIQMGGHGPYVWSAYVISLSVLIWLIVSPLRRKAKLLKDIAREQQRDLARQGTNGSSNVST
jgi:heme exporter protein D